MKRTHFFGTMIAFLTAASAVAAGQQAASEQTTGSEKPKTVVVVGCLASGAQSSSGAVGTSGTAGAAMPGAAASASSFILVNATMGSGASTTPDTPPATPPSTPPSAYPGTAGTSGAAASGAGSSFVLTGGDSTELQKYLNSKVEIRGTLDTKRSAPDSPSASTTGTAASSAPAQHLRVTSVKQIAESCSQ